MRNTGLVFLNRMFDRFYTAAETGGSGLGLSIARSLAMRHGLSRRGAAARRRRLSVSSGNARARRSGGFRPSFALAGSALAAMLWTVLPIAILLAGVGYVAISVRRNRHEHRARSEERAALLLAAMHGRAVERRDPARASMRS